MKKKITKIIAAVITCMMLAQATFAYTEQEVMDLVQATISATMANLEVTYEARDGDFYVTISNPEIKKDVVMPNKDAQEVKDAWQAVLDGFGGTSLAGYEVIQQFGYEDRLFSVLVVDDAYTNSSDVMMVAVNGHIVYDFLA